MEFRAPVVAAQQNARAQAYLTEKLTDVESGRRRFDNLIADLGNVVDVFPDWHPILTAPEQGMVGNTNLHALPAYQGIDHTIEFVRGFVTCPYSDADADDIVTAVNKIAGLQSYRLDGPLYSDMASPVVVEALDLGLEADGTIRSRDALAWFTKQLAKEAFSAQVAETWWNVRSLVLGQPHGSRSSLFVNQHTGMHMRKILEAMNASGMFGPIKERSLTMLSRRKLDKISETLLRSAINSRKHDEEICEFELRGEICKARFKDVWGDNMEISVRVEIGKFDVLASGFYYPDEDKLTYMNPTGKRALAEKFA